MPAPTGWRVPSIQGIHFIIVDCLPIVHCSNLDEIKSILLEDDNLKSFNLMMYEHSAEMLAIAIIHRIIVCVYEVRLARRPICLGTLIPVAKSPCAFNFFPQPIDFNALGLFSVLLSVHLLHSNGAAV